MGIDLNFKRQGLSELLQTGAAQPNFGLYPRAAMPCLFGSIL